MKNIRIIFIVERGILEQQTIWSLKSIRAFGNSIASCSVTCYSPRALFYPSKKTIKALQTLGATVILKNLNIDFKYYALANKPIVLKEVADSYPDEHIVFLDSDTLVFNDFQSIFSDSFEVAAAPVFEQGIGISNPQEKNASYWKAICEHSGLTLNELPSVRTGVRNKKITAYYNTGVIAINKSVLAKLANVWIDLIHYSISNKIIPTTGLYFVEQSTFSLSVHSLGLNMKTLSLAHNFPIIAGAKDLLKSFNSDQILLVHHQGNIELLLDFLKEEETTSDQYRWLIAQHSQYSRIQQSINKFWKWRKNILERTIYVIQDRLR